MTPKEKAKELANKMHIESDIIYIMSKVQAKKCALIAIDLRLDGDFIFTSIEYGVDSLEYWQEVKTEIEKL